MSERATEELGDQSLLEEDASDRGAYIPQPRLFQHMWPGTVIKIHAVMSH